MSKRYIVHIGPHKTGTTSIQEYLSKNKDALLAQGILYPVSGRVFKGKVWRNHHHIMRSYLSKAASFDDLRRALETEIAQARPHIVVISGEMLSKAKLSLEDFKGFLSAIGMEQAEIVYYRRDPTARLVSHCAEIIKGGHVATRADIETLCRNPVFDDAARIAYFTQAANSKQVTVKNFETCLPGLERDFCTTVLGADITEFRDVEIQNQQMSWRLLKITMVANSFPKPVAKQLRRALRYLSFIKGGTPPKSLTNGVPPAS